MKQMEKTCTKILAVDLRTAPCGGLMETLPEKRQTELSLLRPADRIRSLFAEIALRTMLFDEGISPSDVEIVRGENRKPALKGGEVQFNLSHSGDVAVCAVSEFPVGADVELCVPRQTEALAARMFPMLRAGATDEALYAHWTARESLIKYLGLGVAGLRRTEIFDGVCTLDGKPLPCRIHTEFFENGGTYAISLCHEGESVSLERVRADVLARNYLHRLSRL